MEIYIPKDHWTLKTGYFEEPTPAIQVQTLPLEGPRSLGKSKNIGIKQLIGMERNNQVAICAPWGAVYKGCKPRVWKRCFAGDTVHPFNMTLFLNGDI